MTRAFTDREELAGQPVEPGGSDVWEFVPKANKRISPDVSRLDKYAVVNENPVLIGDTYNPFMNPTPIKPINDMDPATAPTQPLETMERNIPMDRDKFKLSLIEQLKEDPTSVNISAKATTMVMGSLQNLWGHVFQEKIPWGGRLTDDQMKFWNKEKSSYYANVYNKVLEQNKLDRETWKASLDRFDTEKKRIEDARYKQTPGEKMAGEKEMVRFKAGEKTKEPDMATIYGPEGQTKRVPLTKGKEYVPPKGWSLKAEKEPSEYTPQQKVDDARQYYSMKMKSLLDPMGIGIREGKEGEYNILMQELADDINAVQSGKTPKYLKTPEGKTLTDDIAKDYLKKANGDKEKARALARADGYKF